MYDYIEEFLEQMSDALYNGGKNDEIADTDHPACPQCGATMNFHGDDMQLPNGEGYWECPSCNFSFCEDEVW